MDVGVACDLNADRSLRVAPEEAASEMPSCETDDQAGSRPGMDLESCGADIPPCRHRRRRPRRMGT